MSSIRDALDRLDLAVGRLEITAERVEPDDGFVSVAVDDDIIDPAFLVGRIDRAIACVEMLLSEGV